jgi:hypothetical protein
LIDDAIIRLSKQRRMGFKFKGSDNFKYGVRVYCENGVGESGEGKLKC